MNVNLGGRERSFIHCFTLPVAASVRWEWTRLKPGAKLNPGILHGCRGPSTWTIFAALPGASARTQTGRGSSQDQNQGFLTAQHRPLYQKSFNCKTVLALKPIFSSLFLRGRKQLRCTYHTHISVISPQSIYKIIPISRIFITSFNFHWMLILENWGEKHNSETNPLILAYFSHLLI